MRVKFVALDLETTDPAPIELDAESDYRDGGVSDNYYAGVDRFIPDWTDETHQRAFMSGYLEFSEKTGLGKYISVKGDDIIHSTFNLLGEKGVKTVGFYYNLAYDTEFFKSYLLNMGYTEFVRTEDRREPNKGEYALLENDMGVVYSLSWRNPVNGGMVELRDAMKLLGGSSLASLAKSLGLPGKLEDDFDYNMVRPVGYVPTDKEEEYLFRDCEILALALSAIFKREPLFKSKLTIGSVARAWFITHSLGKGNYKNGNQIYRQLFPVLDPELDAELREGYVGGYCRINDQYRGGYNREIIRVTEGVGRVYDVNSLYPSVQYGHRYPVGEPWNEDPHTWKDNGSDVGFVRIAVAAKVKENHFPTLQAKGTFRFGDTEYISDTGEDPIYLTMPLPLYRLMHEQYDIAYESVVKVWLFGSVPDIFDHYVDYWYKVKAQAKIDGDMVLYLISKLMLNNLYGKLAQSGKRGSAHIYLDEEGVVRKNVSWEEGDAEYIPAGAYVTAYARCKLVRAAQPIFKNVAYMDTDSIHCDVELDEEIDGVALGAWDHESDWTMARFIRQKCYVEYVVGKDGMYVDIKAGGATKAVKENLQSYSNTWGINEDGKQTWLGAWNAETRVWDGLGDGSPREAVDVIERFAPGVAEIGKLMRKTVPGGVRLVNTTWRISVPEGVVVDPETGIEPVKYLDVVGVV